MLGLLLSGCSLIYRPDLQQGNAIARPVLTRLKIGMSQDQVRYLLGTPVLQSPFQSDRWDYVCTYQPGHGKRVQQRMSLLFSKGVLRKIQIS